jgi:hypothetical protein
MVPAATSMRVQGAEGDDANPVSGRQAAMTLGDGVSVIAVAITVYSAPFRTAARAPTGDVGVDTHIKTLRYTRSYSGRACRNRATGTLKVRCSVEVERRPAVASSVGTSIDPPSIW